MSNIGSKSLTTFMKSPLSGGNVRHANGHGRLEKWTLWIREDVHLVAPHASREDKACILQKLYLPAQHGQHLVSGIRNKKFNHLV